MNSNPPRAELARMSLIVRKILFVFSAYLIVKGAPRAQKKKKKQVGRSGRGNSNVMKTDRWWDSTERRTVKTGTGGEELRGNCAA